VGDCTIRGVYRTSAAKWLHPQDSTPDGSRPHPGGPSAASGAMLSPLTTTRDGFQIQLRFSSAAAPLSLAFTVEDSPPQEHEGEQQSTAAGRERSVTTHHRRPFVVPVGMRQGSPLILGKLFRLSFRAIEPFHPGDLPPMADCS
jgi:hypothetical protein